MNNNELKEFEERWKEKCKEIKNNPMPRQECLVFRNLFKIELLSIELLHPDFKNYDDFFDITNSISMDVDHAIIFSLSKWKDKHPGLLENLSKSIKKISIFGR
jgi:hypothetical protein